MHLIFINETWPYLFETDKNLSSFSTRISRASNLCLPFHRLHGYNFHLFLCRLRDNRENVGQVAGGKLIKHVPINFAPQHSGNVANENQRQAREREFIQSLGINRTQGGGRMALEVSFANANLFTNDVFETGDQSI